MPIKKQKQISQLSNDLSKTQSEKIQIAESLTQSKKETNAALAEIVRLKKQLGQKQTNASRKSLQQAYQQQIEQLSLNELENSALKLDNEGNHVAANRLWKKAAEQGSAVGQYKLGRMYYNGEGVSRDAKQAIYWFRKSAMQGNSDSQIYLGLMYLKGEGVKRDAKQGAYWSHKAADQGDSGGQFVLGSLFYKGEGVTRDAAQAAYWWHKAGDQGEPLAQYDLGFLYYNGEGVTHDAAQATYWWQKAAAQGNEDARKELRRIKADK